MTRTIAKSKLPTDVQQFLQEVVTNGSEIIVTDHDIPILKIVPIVRKQTVDEAFATWRGKASFDKEAVEASTIDEWTEV